MNQLFKSKNALLKQLHEKYNSMPKSINRQAYVLKIMDIVKNYQRQKIEIERVLSDIRTLQRDVNSASEVTKRSSLVVKDMIYKAAQDYSPPDASLLESLESLIAFEASFDELVEGVSLIGKSRNDGRDIDVKIKAFDMESLQSKIAQVRSDWESVKSENAGIIARIKSL
jgi:hypothetical protein